MTKTKNNKTKFISNDSYGLEINQELLNTIFNDEWYNNVSDTINYAIEKTKNVKNVNIDNIIHSVIDYNINKRLETEVLNKLTDYLPKELDWREIDVISAFNEFKDIIDTCDVCPNFKKYTLKIKTPKKSILNNEILIWKEIVNSNYPDLTIIMKELKTEKAYKLVISKRIN